MRRVALALGLLLSLAGAEEPQAPPPVTGVGAWFVGGTEPPEPPAWTKDGALDFEALRGKVVVLEFWMTWCPGCARARPALVKLHEEHPDDLLVLGITATDAKQSAADARRYVAEHVPFPVALLASGETIARYEVGKIPHAVVVDREGRVRWRGNPDREAKAFRRAVRAALRARVD